MGQPVHRTLFIDLDSTFWPAEVEYTRSEMRMHGTDDLISNWYDIPQLIEKYGENYKDIFWDALHPDKVLHRNTYPGAIEAVLNLKYNQGFDIHFITHNPFPSAMEDPLTLWLDIKLCGMPFLLTVYDEGNCKAETMKEDPNAWAIVEDKPSTANEAMRNGYRVYMKHQVWNHDYVLHNMDVRYFNNWFALPPLVSWDLTIERKYAKVKESA